jgi:serine/threonine protein kinase
MGQYLNQNLIIIILKGIINGLNYLHKRNVIYRDITPDNIMIDKNNNIKITDFGISTYYQMNNSQNIYNNSINNPYLTIIAKKII